MLIATENCMIKVERLGVLQSPASTLILHYGEYTTSQSFRPCDFAFLSNLNKELSGDISKPSVTVLVSPSNYPSMKVQYTAVPGVTVLPFLIQPAELTTSTMLALMGVSNTDSPPLYVNQITNILQQMSSETSGPFCYETFRKRLGGQSSVASNGSTSASASNCLSRSSISRENQLRPGLFRARSPSSTSPARLWMKTPRASSSISV